MLREEIQYGFIRRYGAVAQIIAAVAGIFLLMAILNFSLFLFNASAVLQPFFRWLALPSNLKELLFQPWSLFTYPFIQVPSNFLTVLFTMLWLFWFGILFQEYQGGKRLWALFISGSLFGAIAYLISLNIFPVFAGTNHLLMGASTGVSTIIIATATLIPHYRMNLFLFGSVKLFWVAIATVLIDIVLIQIGDPASRIAQLGGAFWGFLYMKQFQQGRDWLYPFLWVAEQGEGFMKQNRKAKLKIVTNHLSHSNNKPNQAEIDRILDKINKVGYEKLTKEEKQTLFNASND